MSLRLVTAVPGLVLLSLEAVNTGRKTLLSEDLFSFLFLNSVRLLVMKTKDVKIVFSCFCFF